MTPPPDRHRKRPATGALAIAFVLIYLSWGTTFIAIKAGVRDEQLPPALFGGVRVCLAGLALLVYLALRRHPLAISRRDLGSIVAASLLLFVVGNGLINLAEQTVDSGVAAILVATSPLLIGFFEMFWPGGERLNSRGWLGLSIGLGGVLVLLAPRLGEADALWQDAGLLLVLGSASAWSFGLLVMRHRHLACSHLTAAAYQMFIGGGLLALVGLFIGEIDELPDRITPRAAAAFLYLLMVGSLVGFVSFNWLLGHVSAAKVSTFAYVNPVIAVFIGWLVGEDITTWMLAGVLIILTGVALVRGGAGAEQRIPDLTLVAPEGSPEDDCVVCSGRN